MTNIFLWYIEITKTFNPAALTPLRYQDRNIIAWTFTNSATTALHCIRRHVSELQTLKLTIQEVNNTRNSKLINNSEIIVDLFSLITFSFASRNYEIFFGSQIVRHKSWRARQSSETGSGCGNPHAGFLIDIRINDATEFLDISSIFLPCASHFKPIYMSNWYLLSLSNTSAGGVYCRTNNSPCWITLCSVFG